MSSLDPKATPAERFALVLELHELAVEQMRANLSRRMPSATAEQIETKLAEWSMHRPGAEDGDGVGRRVDPRERFAMDERLLARSEPTSSEPITPLSVVPTRHPERFGTMLGSVQVRGDVEAPVADAEESTLLRELAVQLYARELLPKAAARRFSGLDRIAFDELLGQRGLASRLSVEDFDADLAGLEPAVVGESSTITTP